MYIYIVGSFEEMLTSEYRYVFILLHKLHGFHIRINILIYQIFVVDICSEHVAKNLILNNFKKVIGC
jgi:hypothetical protein